MIPDTVRNSRGIACCRYDKDDELELLLVQKRYTHSFAAFVFGEYESFDTEYLRKLMNGMTLQEKINIGLGRYDILHSHIWGILPQYGDDEEDTKSRVDGWKTPKRRRSNQWKRLYTQRRAKYDEHMAADGDYIKTMLRGADSVELPWEIPKGRREQGEATLDWAKREFREETGMPSEKFMIMPEILPIQDLRRSPGKTYVSKYHVAYCCDPKYKPLVRYASFSQRVELCAIKWMTAADIERIGDEQLETTARRIFTAVGAKYEYILNRFRRN